MIDLIKYENRELYTDLQDNDMDELIMDYRAIKDEYEIALSNIQIAEEDTFEQMEWVAWADEAYEQIGTLQGMMDDLLEEVLVDHMTEFIEEDDNLGTLQNIKADMSIGILTVTLVHKDYSIISSMLGGSHSMTLDVRNKCVISPLLDSISLVKVANKWYNVFTKATRDEVL